MARGYTHLEHTCPSLGEVVYECPSDLCSGSLQLVDVTHLFNPLWVTHHLPSSLVHRPVFLQSNNGHLIEPLSNRRFVLIIRVHLDLLKVNQN